eukprot:5269663-Amphidinium_carterae.1
MQFKYRTPKKYGNSFGSYFRLGCCAIARQASVCVCVFKAISLESRCLPKGALRLGRMAKGKRNQGPAQPRRGNMAAKSVAQMDDGSDDAAQVKSELMPWPSDPVDKRLTIE